MSYWATVESQIMGLKEIPMVTLANWPAYFSFAAVRVVSGTVINMIPNLGGYPGVIVNAGIAGFTDVVKFVTWEKVRVQ